MTISLLASQKLTIGYNLIIASKHGARVLVVTLRVYACVCSDAESVECGLRYVCRSRGHRVEDFLAANAFARDGVLTAINQRIPSKFLNTCQSFF